MYDCQKWYLSNLNFWTKLWVYNHERNVRSKNKIQVCSMCCLKFSGSGIMSWGYSRHRRIAALWLCRHPTQNNNNILYWCPYIYCNTGSSQSKLLTSLSSPLTSPGAICLRNAKTTSGKENSAFSGPTSFFYKSKQ